MKELDFEDIYHEAKRLVKRSKKVMRLLYQLAFIESSGSPDSDKAHELIEEMIKKGLITRAQYYKALDDVERWRKRVLDKMFRTI